MNMINSHYTLTRNQLEVFREICLGKETVSEILRSSSQSSKTVYRITEALLEFGIITRSEGRGARFSPSDGIHSAALKRYLLSKEHPIDAIVGSKLLLLLSISQMPKSMERIAKETGLMRDTVRVLAWSLRNLGIVAQEGSKIAISETDLFMKQFLQDFSKGVNLSIMQGRTKVGILIWSGGLEFIFSTPSLDNSTRIRMTGISAMAMYGIQFISETNYYYYSNWNADLKPEDIAIHNLLTDRFNSRVIGYSILLIKKTGFDADYLLEESRYAGIDRLVKDIMNFVNGRPVKNRYMPSIADMEDLMVQYGVN
jgi:hypothetical protein